MRVNVKEGSGNHFYSTPASETTSKTVNSKMSSVDKMKKLLSPGTRKKGLGNRTFGVPLEELMSRAASGASVPYVSVKYANIYVTKDLKQREFSELTAAQE